jgi:hypothetical protein
MQSEMTNVLSPMVANSQVSGEHLDVDKGWGYLEHLLFKQHLLWIQSDAHERRRSVQMVFPSGVGCSTNGFGTPVAHSLFSMIEDKNVQEEDW